MREFEAFDPSDEALVELRTEWCAAASRLLREIALSGPHDRHPALLSVRAGAGGADARAWADQLVAMYAAWAREEGRAAHLVDERHGEGGLRAATLRIGGRDAYGWLRGEIGVHRVSHLSRFGARGKRQTSFAAVEVLPELPVVAHRLELGAVRMDTYRASGPGGQHRNKTDSAVRATHEETGITAHASGDRSQHANRAAALALLTARVRAYEDEQRERSLSAGRVMAPPPSFGARRRSYVLHPYTAVSDDDGAWKARSADILTGNLTPALEADFMRRLESHA